MRNWNETLVEQVRSWPGVACSDHRFGGVEFRLGAREIGHVHNFGIVDIPFTVKIRDALIGAHRAERHHWLPDSGWTTVRIAKRGAESAEIGNALALLRFSYLRILARSADPTAAARIGSELQSLPLEPEVLHAAGIA
jgi:Family of unknown function (DUF5519)